MSRPTREDFEKAIQNFWHDRPPASLEDVMALYGVLAVAESGGELYHTPTALEPFVDDGRLITIDVDLTVQTPEVVDIHVDVLREEDVDNLEYSHKSSGQGSKYSITQIGSNSGNDAVGVTDTRYGPLGKLAGWATQDSIVSLTEEGDHPDAWVIAELRQVLEKKSASLEDVKESLLELLPPDQSLPTVLTVRVRVDNADLEMTDTTGEEWFWPAELDVLNEAMKRYATANAADKNMDSGSSEGEGVGVVTGQKGRVVGTPESPLGVFSVKHPDAQPGLRQDQSWRNYPVNADVAMLFSKGQDLVEKCVYRNGGMETYALPFFAGELTAEKAQALYGAIQSLDEENDYDESEAAAPMARVTYELRESENETLQQLAERELRFYTITLPISDDKNVIAEEPAATTYWVSELADALAKTVHGPTLTPSRGGFQVFDNWPLLEFPDDLTQARKLAFYRIVGHTFTNAVFAYRDEEEEDDFRRVVDARLIAGTPLSVEMLFDEYLRRYTNASEDGERPPHQVVV